MKQNITVKQLNELSDKGKTKLWKWMVDNKYMDKVQMCLCEDVTNHKNAKCLEKLLPLFSIGQMIEFLRQPQVEKALFLHPVRETEQLLHKNEWCDHLWEACKELLNN